MYWKVNQHSRLTMNSRVKPEQTSIPVVFFNNKPLSYIVVVRNNILNVLLGRLIYDLNNYKRWWNVWKIADLCWVLYLFKETWYITYNLQRIPYYGGSLAIGVSYHIPKTTPTPTAAVETVYFLSNTRVSTRRLVLTVFLWKPFRVFIEEVGHNISQEALNGIECQNKTTFINRFI